MDFIKILFYFEVGMISGMLLTLMLLILKRKMLDKKIEREGGTVKVFKIKTKLL